MENGLVSIESFMQEVLPFEFSFEFWLIQLHQRLGEWVTYQSVLSIKTYFWPGLSFNYIESIFQA